MQKQGIQRGRPTGATTFEAGPARAFGDAVRSLRTGDGIAQETLAHLAYLCGQGRLQRELQQDGSYQYRVKAV